MMSNRSISTLYNQLIGRVKFSAVRLQSKESRPIADPALVCGEGPGFGYRIKVWRSPANKKGVTNDSGRAIGLGQAFRF